MAVSIRRREGPVALSDPGPGIGMRHRQAWLPESPSRVMILVHGYAEHVGRYEAMAAHFAARGYAVHAYDQAGHGRSPGPRGHVDRFDRLIDELARFVEIVGGEHPGLPITLVGHSMGGLVSAATAAFRHPAVDRIVLSGALLEVAGGESVGRRLQIVLARILARVAPRVGLSTGLDAEGLSRDPEVVRRYREDPLVKDRMTARFAAGLFATVDALRAAFDRIDRPVLILHGGADPICPVAGSRLLFERLSPVVAKQSRLTVYPGLRHEIFNEPEHAAIWDELQAWIEA